MADTMPREDIREREQVAEPEVEAGGKHAAWWLSTRRRRPEWQSLMASGAATFSGRPRAHFEAARPGDPVLIYVSKSDHAIRAVGVVIGTKDGRRPTTDDRRVNSENGPPSILRKLRTHPPSSDSELEVQLAFEVTSALTWREILAVPTL